MPKISTVPSISKYTRRHNPLEADITAVASVKSRPPKRQKNFQNEAANFVDSKATRKILRMGQELEDEDLKERNSALKSAFNFDVRIEYEENEEEEENEIEYDEWEDENAEEVFEVEVTDFETFNKFLPEEEHSLLKNGWGGQKDNDSDVQGGSGTNLADLILEKIAAQEASQKSNGQKPQGGFQRSHEELQIPEKVIDVYTKVGLILSRYKSGKLPKPFKILPTIPYWEEILDITCPEKWTPNACYEATKIFISSTPIKSQRFMENIILPRVRDQIHETKKLNVHLFNCLKKGLYRPAAWFKGFLFPLVASGSCTLREAHIVSAVLVRVSIPVLHSAAAIKGLCDIAAQESSAETEGGGATNIFIKALLEKKYALPYQVIDALVFHFLRFRGIRNEQSDKMRDEELSREPDIKETRLPVIWHQCLLKFAQRYRNDITEDQREALLDLLVEKGHHQIGPEVRRELLEGRERGIPIKTDTNMLDGDDTLMSD
ncbi:hypothetical protein HI914_04267 [Erysiphe necator]|uniref:Putative rrna processing protein bystin n=1 Tax=Uncinula necator TaxID=52586 RepID=A0A0B1P197_UNCNE|nr:hypothetical protein HI914_04267 [Erysiphe necator]KHJ30599.1 putative rrna processing protein bystin [Erysiphe necator]